MKEVKFIVKCKSKDLIEKIQEEYKNEQRKWFKIH